MVSAIQCLTLSRRRVHDRPFREKGGEELSQESQETARDALLQFNLMIERGVQPDALSYTSLIATMGRARLEWQAYKLFSRMLEQNVRPLPETYVALRDATSPKRLQLLNDLNRKIEECVEKFPDELATSVAKQQREDDLKCVARFEEYINSDAPFLQGPTEEEATSSSGGNGKSADESYQRVHIRNPADVWGTHKALESLGMLGSSIDAPEVDLAAKTELITALEKMHEEELRIFLSVKKQLRHGNKAELIRRIVDTVGSLAIREMLRRRHRYFNAVGDLLEMDLERMRGGPDGSSNATNLHAVPDAARSTVRTPWGIIHKPRALPSRATWTGVQEVNQEKVERIKLTGEELDLVFRKAKLGEMDELPLSLLRRYAFQFQLGWKRSEQQSLVDIVSWHARTLLPHHGNNTAQTATPSLRRQQHNSDTQKTLENFEAFRIISQRTQNLQVVDSKEINLHIKNEKLATHVREKRSDVHQRRERHLNEAAMLQRQAREFMPIEEPQVSSMGGSRVVGAAPPPAELPPWALEADSGRAYNFKTGRFGDPSKGSLQELSDGKIRALPNREAMDTHHVDLGTLPATMRDSIQRAQLAEQQEANARAVKQEERLGFRKFKKFHSFVERAKQRRQEEKDQSPSVKPLQPKRRMVHNLRRGLDSVHINETDAERFLRTSL